MAERYCKIILSSVLILLCAPLIANADQTATLASTFVTSGSGGLDTPTSLVFGPAGDLYVVSFANKQILRYAGDTGAFKSVLTTFVSAEPVNLLNKAIYDKPNLPYPYNHTNSLLVSLFEADQVFRWDFGPYACPVGQDCSSQPPTWRGVFIEGGGLDGPQDMVVGPGGYIYIASYNSKNVLKYDGNTGAFVGVFASGNGLEHPRTLTFGPDGNLYVASYNDTLSGNKIFKYNGTTGEFLGAFCDTNDPWDMEFGPDGNLYVSDHSARSIARYNGTTGAAIDYYDPDGGAWSVFPFSITFGPGGKLFVSDSWNKRILNYYDALVPGCPTGVNDSDGDGVCDNEDRCLNQPNPRSNWIDINGLPHTYEVPDFDLDGIPDACDNCRNTANPNQENSDTDALGNACDNCPYVYNPDQNDNVCRDNDQDGVPAVNDCDDNDKTVFPGAPEICGDGKKNDCNRRGKDISCLDMYAPVLYSSEAYYTTPGTKDYKPKQVESILKESTLRGPAYWVCTDTACVCTDGYFDWDGLNSRWVCTKRSCFCDSGTFTHTYVEKPVRTSDLYSSDTSGFYLDMSDADPGLSTGDSNRPNPSRFDIYPNTVYGREEVFTRDYPDTPYRALQYWLFYPYNDFSGDRHEGDWEMVQVILDESTRQPVAAPNYAVTYSQHSGGVSKTWDDSDVEKADGTHPIVYIGEGSHANYFKGGEHTIELCFTDWTKPISALVPLSIYDSYSNQPLLKEAYQIVPISSLTPWVGWNGHWGEIDGGTGVPYPLSPASIVTFTSGPQGPGKKGSWNDPIGFANNPGETSVVGCAFSPVNVHIYDSAGNHVGPTATGEFESKIPGVYLYDPENKRFIINTSDNLKFKLEATGSGEFDFVVSKYQKDTARQTAVTYNKVQITDQTTAVVNVATLNPNYTMEIDLNGDGSTDLRKAPDNIDEVQKSVGRLDTNATPSSIPGTEDGDADGIAGSMDNCPTRFNPDQGDINNNGIGNLCEPDSTPPSIIIDSCPVTANYRSRTLINVAVSDGESDVAFQSVPNGINGLDTSNIGNFVFNVNARDNMGNINTKSCTYKVIYDFVGAGGFQPPIDDKPTVNIAKAGSTIPVKWQLPDGKGGFVSDLSAVKSIQIEEIACANFSTSITDPVETTATGNTSLRYDSTSSQFIYNWQTAKNQAGKCYVLSLNLNDGVEVSGQLFVKITAAMYKK